METLHTQLQDYLCTQVRQLGEWKVRLNDTYFNALMSKCHEDNVLLSLDSNANQVFRGSDMSNFIGNYDAETGKEFRYSNLLPIIDLDTYMGGLSRLGVDSEVRGYVS